MMIQYIGILDGSTGAYGVVFPDLPGCTSMGETLYEAAQNSAGAACLWIERVLVRGDVVPRARTISELMANEAVMTDIIVSQGVMIPVLVPVRRAPFPTGSKP